MNNNEKIVCIKKENAKSIMVNITFILPLDKDHAHLNALIPNVLASGTENFKTIRDINLKLDSLYNTEFYFGINKLADSHKIDFTIEFVNPKYISNCDIISEVSKLLNEIITKPLIENGKFKQEYFEREKKELKDKINSVINDKTQYSMIKCIELMCKDEPWGINKYGDINKLEECTNEELYDYYKNNFLNSAIAIGICGDITDEEINKIISNIDLNIVNKDVSMIYKTNDRVKTAEEIMDVNQAKICIGYRIEDYDINKDMYAATIYSSILGGSASSKLFINVREKNSLAYHIASIFYNYKGIMLIEGGTLTENIEKTTELINIQYNDMNNGNFTDEELNIAKKLIISHVKQNQDYKYTILKNVIDMSLVTKSKFNINDYIQNIQNVNREDIINIGKRMNKQSFYAIKGGNCEENK